MTDRVYGGRFAQQFRALDGRLPYGLFSVKAQDYGTCANEGVKGGVGFVIASGEAPVLFEVVGGLLDVVEFGVGTRAYSPTAATAPTAGAPI